MQHYAPSRQEPHEYPREPLPVRPRPGTDVGHIQVVKYSQTILLPIRVPGCTASRNRPRSDQYAVQIDGEWALMSYRAAALHAVGELDREMSARKLALYGGY
jgi:hypothetical protein